MHEVLWARTPPPPQTVDNKMDKSVGMDYRFEQARLESFENWPSPYVRPAELAAAGFYYTNESDKVRCFECKMEICRWEEGDDPMVEHQRWTSRCRFICKRSCGNVPRGADPRTIKMPCPHSHDVGIRYRLEYRLDAEADAHISFRGVRLEANESGVILQQVQPEITSEREPDPSGGKQSSPMSRVSIESQKEQMPYASANSNSSVSATEDQSQVDQEQQQPSAKKTSEDLGICKICFIEELGVVFIPCGHMACVKCAPEITTCAMCRSPVAMTMRAFLS